MPRDAAGTSHASDRHTKVVSPDAVAGGNFSKSFDLDGVVGIVVSGCRLNSWCLQFRFFRCTGPFQLI